jgi:hypothetical protein
LDRLGGVDREPKAARTRSAFDKFREPRLEERSSAALEPANLLLVLVDPDHVVLERRQGCRSGQPNVTGTDDDNAHCGPLPDRGWSQASYRGRYALAVGR